MSIKSIEKKIEGVKEKLLNLDDMHPGSLSKQYNVCGKAGCRCKDLNDPKKHGPYYQLSFSHKGKSTSRFIKDENLAEVKRHLAAYKKFKLLVDDWKGLAVELAKLRIDEAKSKK